MFSLFNRAEVKPMPQSAPMPFGKVSDAAVGVGDPDRYPDRVNLFGCC